jgi:hypothetical protein
MSARLQLDPWSLLAGLAPLVDLAVVLAILRARRTRCWSCASPSSRCCRAPSRCVEAVTAAAIAR